MADDELCYLSAAEALALFKKRKLSPVELMTAIIRRAEKTEPKVNALPITLFEEAIAAARKAEAVYARKSGRPRSLEGLALAIKDESHMAGANTTSGSLLLKDAIDEDTDPAVERILKAGAIVHARSAAPEFSCAPWTHSRIWGVTRTPWNLKFSPGGSSGGAGAALAAGSTTLANGSDIGGSIRIPAAMSGVVGFKPPYGRNPEITPFNLDHYCHVGPMARSVLDCALLQNVMAGPHPKDIVSLWPKVEVPTRFRSIKGWKLAVSYDLGGYDIDPDVLKNTRRAVRIFKELGCQVEEVEVGWTRAEIAQAARAHFGTIFGAWIGQYLEGHADLMTDYAQHFAKRAAEIDKAEYMKGLEIEGKVYDYFGPLMERYRIFLCPTLPVPSVEAGNSYLTEQLLINGNPQGDIEDWLTTIVFNIMSRCPVLAVPSGFAKGKVPTGLSIVGRTYDDESVFHAGAAYESALGGFYRDTKSRPKL